MLSQRGDDNVVRVVAYGEIITLLREPLRDLGKISMEFLHLGGLQGNHWEIWENLNGVASFGGIHEGITGKFGKISMEFLHLGGLQGNHTVVSKVQVTNTRMDQ